MAVARAVEDPRTVQVTEMAQDKIKLLHGHEDDLPLTASILNTAGSGVGKCKLVKSSHKYTSWRELTRGFDGLSLRRRRLSTRRLVGRRPATKITVTQKPLLINDFYQAILGPGLPIAPIREVFLQAG